MPESLRATHRFFSGIRNRTKILTPQEKTASAANLLSIIAWGIYFLSEGNIHDLAYVFLNLVFFLAVWSTVQRSYLGEPLLWAVFVWGLLNTLAGSTDINGVSLYSISLKDIFGSSAPGALIFFRYDRMIHFLAFGITTTYFFHLLHGPFKTKTENRRTVYLAAFLAGIGLGSINETVEFSASWIIGHLGMYGGYVDTNVDLIANTIGAFFALLVIFLVEKWRTKKEKAAEKRARAIISK
ncbi:MAG TPA: hypothetical protein VFM02_01520 [Candidatus Paceibacterota bacterium]|nr:hypothetical protein [Candidatus Paceibacterota bacterium]